MSEESEKNRRIYGKGYHDGIDYAIEFVIKRGGYMVTNEKFMETFNNMNTNMRAVYLAIPDDLPASPGEVFSTLNKAGKNISHSSILGCMKSLQEHGLLKSEKNTRFSKIQIKPPKEKRQITKREPCPSSNAVEKPEAKEESILMVAQKQAGKTPLDSLAEISQRARKISEELVSFIAMVESAAIDIEHSFEESERKSEKLKQLQALLKGLSD